MYSMTQLIPGRPARRAAALAATVLLVPILAAAQSRGGGGGGPHRDPTPPRSEPAPRRESPPPPRAEPAPRRESPPPARIESAPRRESSPSRTEPGPRRDYFSPRIETRGRDSYTRPNSPYSYGRPGDTLRRDPYIGRTDSSGTRRYDYYTRGSDSALRRDASRRERASAQSGGDLYNDPFIRDWSPRRDTPRDAARSGYARPGDSPRRDAYALPGVTGRADSQNRPVDSPRREVQARPGDGGRGVNDSIFRRDGSRTGNEGIGARAEGPAGATRAPLGSSRRELPGYRNDRAAGIQPFRDRAYDLFTRSEEGRRYSNGVALRRPVYYDPYFRPYFPGGYACYPYYSPNFDAGLVFNSPYYYYDCPPYIYRRHCYYTPPLSVFIEIPVYEGRVARGYDSGGDDYYLSRSRSILESDSDLQRAIDDLRETFRFGNIEPLVQLTDPAIRIAIFQKGKYEYSVEANDFLDMTRDALRSMDTIQYDLYRVHRRADNVVVVSGKHHYRNSDGRQRTVYVSYVLERLAGRYILTQVSTSPDRIEDPR